jgi:hypothetical protein
MGYVGRSDKMANNYSIGRRKFKWMKKLFIHLLDLSILNSYILYPLSESKENSHRDFQITLVRIMLVHAGQEQRTPRPLGRSPNVELHVAMLEVYGSKH